MPRPIRYRAEFAADLRARVDWLRRNRPPQQIENLRAGLATFARRVARFPAIGTEVFRPGTVSYRVFGLGRLPYLVWYFYDEAKPAGAIWLAMLLHEKQDRERFDPDAFE